MCAIYVSSYTCITSISIACLRCIKVDSLFLQWLVCHYCCSITPSKSIDVIGVKVDMSEHEVNTLTDWQRRDVGSMLISQSTHRGSHGFRWPLKTVYLNNSKWDIGLEDVIVWPVFIANSDLFPMHRWSRQQVHGADWTDKRADFLREAAQILHGRQ